MHAKAYPLLGPATRPPSNTGAPINSTRHPGSRGAAETVRDLQPALRAADPGSARSRFSATAAAGMTGGLDHSLQKNRRWRGGDT